MGHGTHCRRLRSGCKFVHWRIESLLGTEHKRANLCRFTVGSSFQSREEISLAAGTLEQTLRSPRLNRLPFAPDLCALEASLRIPAGSHLCRLVDDYHRFAQYSLRRSDPPCEALQSAARPCSPFPPTG